VNQKQRKHLSAICQCGKVKFEAVGPPILTRLRQLRHELGCRCDRKLLMWR